MTIDLQIKINSDYRLKSFIRENPIWYKRLNRTRESFPYFVEEMKKNYKLTTEDKINKTIDNISMLQGFLDVLK